jgi:hypothetical protein
MASGWALVPTEILSSDSTHVSRRIKNKAIIRTVMRYGPT